MPPVLVGKTLLNQFRVEEFMALGPAGEIYRATDTYRNKALTFTLLPASVSENVERIKELEIGAPRLRSIAHPNLTSYLGLFQTPKYAFLLEEWIDGPSLIEIIRKSPIPAAEVLVYAKSLCAALESLHAKKLLHLKLSPELIRIDRKGEIHLGGIGYARAFDEKPTEHLEKYPALYLAPEQLLGQPLSTATDIYALSVLLYQLVTGKWINGKTPPKTSEAVRRAQLILAPPPPITFQKEIPAHFSRMLLWALRKKPAERFKTTTELLSALALAAQISVEHIPPSAEPKNAPVTSAILMDWKYLPAPKPSLVSQDTAPLEDRLASLLPPPPRRPKLRLGFLPFLGLLLMAGITSLFWLFRPAPMVIATPMVMTPFAANFTPQASSTPFPRPTDEHGGRIAFTCTRGDFNQLCMINRDGSGLTQLTDMEASNYYPTFSTDGSSLLFASNRNGAFDMYLLSFSEKQLFQLTTKVGNVISPDYSPDGARIIFANRVGNNPTSIWMMNADGSNPLPVYQGTDTIVAVAWSPVGDRIAYAMSVGIPQEYEIFIMDTEGKNHIRLTQGLGGIGGSLDWSPDGKYLLIYAGPHADKDIFRLDVNNGEFARLTDGGNNAGGSYSPDGRYIVFNSMRNDDQADLYIMRSDGTNPQQLTNHPEPDWDPHWSP